jgi:hypothetical protein
MRGYCWGDVMKATRSPPDEAPPHTLTFTLYTIIGAPSDFVFQKEETSLDSGGLI